jgi:alginate O-acetyltransferase complex protein AlgI
MVFSSLTFVCVFLPMVVAFYFALPKQTNNLVLVVASYLFYGWGDPVALLLIVPSVAMNFQFGRFIDAASGLRRRRIVTAAIAINLGVLVVFKYSDFILGNFNTVLRFITAWQAPLPRLGPPLGISFFTFHIISYLVDVYRGVQRAQQSPLAFTLYIINFPQLIAGPIIRYRQIVDQLGARSVTFSDVDAGIARFCAGLAKKLLIANSIGVIVDSIFAMPATDLTIATAWLGTICYALQIYFDFSGYSDMAIGLARIFGFRFPENFNYPYSAISIQDFWRRWHITLSAWFRDYVYIPLGGNRLGPWKTARNLWVVFFLTGVWHGASWNFIVWGLWHGFFLWLERLDSIHNVLLKMPRSVRNGYVLFVVLVGWVMFRSESMEYATKLLCRMFGLQAATSHSVSISQVTSVPMLTVIVIAAVLAYPVWPRANAMWISATKRGNGPVFDNLVRTAYVTTVMVLSLATMAVGQQNPFLYFRF